MGIDIMKQMLVARIQEGGEQYIRVLFAVSNALQEPVQEEDPIIGYDIEGNSKRASVMQAIYDEQVRAAREEGKFTTLEELETEMEAW
jgi:hypothetical protein